MDQQRVVTPLLADILAAQQMIRPHVWHTPLLPSAGLSRLAGSKVYLKLECWQRTGSFKARGALRKLSTLSPEQWAKGLVTSSAGNHGLGVAYASKVLGLPSVTIFVPENAPAAKIERLQTYNCQVRRAGTDYDAAHAIAETFTHEQGALYISAYDDPVVIAGQGTVGLEVLADLPDADLLLVPVGGGGLIAGIAIAARAINPAIRILGVQPEASPSAYLSLRDGRPHETYPAGPTICDGLAGGFGRVPFEMAGDLIEQIVVVPEADVRRAVAWLLAREQVVVEGAGAIAIAPLLNGQVEAKGSQVVAVLTGRNLDAALLHEILAEQIDSVICTILFDLDDTLYPRQAGIMDQIRTLMLRYIQARFNLSLEEADSLRRQYFQTYGTTMRGIQVNHHIDPDGFLHDVHDMPLDDYLRPNPELDGVLASLPQDKVIFTNASREHAEGVLASLDIRRHFSRIVDIRDMDYESKPHPVAYSRICELLGVQPQGCLLVEDNVRNLRPAKELGMTTVLVDNASQATDACVDYHIHRIEDIKQVVAKIGPNNPTDPC